MIKFISIFLLSLLNVYGHEGGSPTSPAPRFYIGPSIGASQIFARQNLVYNNTAILYEGGFKSSGHHTKPFWGVTGGASIPLSDKNFLDLDIYYVSQDNTAKLSADNKGYIYVSMELKKKYSYGLAFSLGRQFYETPLPLSAYLRVGWERGQIKTTQIYDGNEFAGQAFHQNHTFNAPLAGLGLKLDISPRLFCKVGYTYVFPKDINLFVPYTENGGGYYQYKFTQSEQRFDLTFGWKF